jgi:glycosyltransferase involved in cell wall biosynthesis
VSDAARVTACVIARDEEKHLAALLPTLRWADEVLAMINAESVDRSADVARPLADRVEVRPFGSYAIFRNAALQVASCPWVFFVDADERVSPELAAEVREVTARAGADRPAGYWIPRRNVIFGHVMRAAGWYPDHQLRLLERDRAHYDEARPVHEVVILDGPEGYLEHPLLHFNYQTLAQFIRKQRRYTAMEVTELLMAHGRPRARALLGQPLREFWRRYVQLGGWRDGPVGFFLCLAMGFYAFERTRLARAAPHPAPIA